MQLHGCELEEALELFEACDLSNVIHAAKITRLGEAHEQRAQAYLLKSKAKLTSKNGIVTLAPNQVASISQRP